MKVKILARFISPLTNRRVKLHEIVNVPKNQFWFKRLKDKDCEIIVEMIPKKKEIPKIKDSKFKKSKSAGSK